MAVPPIATSDGIGALASLREGDIVTVRFRVAAVLGGMGYPILIAEGGPLSTPRLTAWFRRADIVSIENSGAKA